ncbi:MAG: inovirus-type Gp2 protein [Thiolinea sp.]
MQTLSSKQTEASSIVPQVFAQAITEHTNVLQDACQPSDQKKRGSLYYQPSSLRQKRTKNSKTITYSNFVQFLGKRYSILQGKQGVFSKIMHRLTEELSASIDLWGRVFALRFDLHHKDIYRENNQWLSQFFKNLKRRLEREYGMATIGYLWVREQEKAKAQHYHVVLFLDGNKIRHSSKINTIISDTWKAVNPSNHVAMPEKPFYFIDNEETLTNAIERISYLAKVRGKGYRNRQVKDFYGSSLYKKVHHPFNGFSLKHTNRFRVGANKEVLETEASHCLVEETL